MVFNILGLTANDEACQAKHNLKEPGRSIKSVDTCSACRRIMCLNMTQPLYDLNAEDFETNSEEILIGFGGFLNYMPCFDCFLLKIWFRSNI